MIEFSDDHLTLSLAVAKAALAFTREDPEAQHLTLGIDRGEVCATDGQTALRFNKGEAGDGPDPQRWNGHLFPRSYLLERMEHREKGGPVVLDWRMAWTLGFPKVHQAEPEPSPRELHESILFDAAYLARLELVSQACRRDREKGEVGAVPCPPVLVTSIGGALDPMRWQVGGPEWGGRAAHVAWVTIMPMRKQTTSLAEVKRANRKSAPRRRRAVA